MQCIETQVKRLKVVNANLEGELKRNQVDRGNFHREKVLQKLREGVTDTEVK